MKTFSPKNKKISPPATILEVNEFDAIRIVRFQGPVDMETVVELELYGKQLERDEELVRKHILLDFSKVTHTDSVTVAALIEMTAILKKEHHKLAVINIGENLRSLFEIYRVNRSILPFLSESEAIKGLTEEG